MSEDRVGASIYRTLRDSWWPHPVHGKIEFHQERQLLVFECVCGERLGIPLFVARDLGLL